MTTPVEAAGEEPPRDEEGLLEFVAHLTSESYREVPDDLVKLGFLRRDRLDTVRASGFLEPLTYMLRQAREGGGGKKVRERIFNEYRAKFPSLSDDELKSEGYTCHVVTGKALPKLEVGGMSSSGKGDMVIGKELISAYAGPADVDSFGDVGKVSETKTIKIE